MNLAELRAKRAELAQQAHAIVATADKAGVEITDAEAEQIASIETEIGGIDAEITAAETRAQVATRARALAQPAGRRFAPKDGPVTESVRDSVRDDPKRGFHTLGHFAEAVQRAGSAPWNDHALMAAAGTGMEQGVREDGGVTVPPAFAATIWDRTRMASNSLLPMTDQIPIDMGVESITFPAVHEVSRADGSRFGGLRGYWKSELTQLTESRPKMREVKLQPNELYVFCYVSDKLLRNSPLALEAFLTSSAADELNFKIGDAIYNGDGLGKPLGIVNAPCAVSVAKETGQVAGTIVTKNINKMYARMHPNWRAGAVWLKNVDTSEQIEGLVQEVGTGGVPVYLPAGGLADAPNARLKGLPVYDVEYAATLGTVGDLMLVNLKAYATAMKGGINSATSMHLKFDYAQTAFRFIIEMDGQPWLHSAITPYKGTATLSPIISLATRS